MIRTIEEINSFYKNKETKELLIENIICELSYLFHSIEKMEEITSEKFLLNKKEVDIIFDRIENEKDFSINSGVAKIISSSNENLYEDIYMYYNFHPNEEPPVFNCHIQSNGYSETQLLCFKIQCQLTAHLKNIRPPGIIGN
jgi:hypothetical protein